MRFTHLLVAVLAVAPRIARANGCPANDIVTTTAQQLPLGCPLVAYDRVQSGSAATVTVVRQDGTATTPLALPVEMRDVALPVSESIFNYTSCQYDVATVDYDFERYQFDTSGLAIGDTVVVTAYTGDSAPITIVAAASCAAEETVHLECSPQGVGDPDQCTGDDDDGGGCATSSPSLLVGALIALVMFGVRKTKTATPKDDRV